MSTAGYDEINRITIFDVWDESERQFVNILNKFRSVYAQEAIGGKVISQFPMGLAIPKNHPSLIKKGTTALVFALPVVYEEYHWKGRGSQKPRYMVGKSS